MEIKQKYRRHISCGKQVLIPQDGFAVISFCKNSEIETLSQWNMALLSIR